MLPISPKRHQRFHRPGSTLLMLALLTFPMSALIAGVPISVSVEQGSSQADPARLVPILFSVSFSEAVTGFDAADVILGGTAGPTQASVTGTGSEYSVAVSGMSLPGTVSIRVPAGAAQNGVGQPNQPSVSIDNVVNFDAIRPTLLAFERRLPLDQVTDADELVFQATFSEPVVPPIAVDFEVDGPTTAQVTSVVPISSMVFDLTVSGGTLPNLNGIVGVNLRPSQVIEDLAGNRLASSEPQLDETYQVVNPGPQADLYILNSDGRASAALNGLLDYVITVGNAGPDAVSGAIVENLVELPLSGASWICEAGPGASCSAFGSGDLLDQVDLAANAEVVYTLTVTVAATTEGSLENTATVEPPIGTSDPMLGNNVATDLTELIEGLFSNSFESLPVAKGGRQKITMAAPASEVGNGFLIHRRFANGWEYRGSFLNAAGHWIPGPWVAEDDQR